MTTKEKTTTASGNTNGSSADIYRKGRNFHIVVQKSLYDDINVFVEYVEKLKCFQYILIAEHDKEDNGELNPHKHIYLQLSECRVLSKKYCSTFHIEPCLGSAQQNYNYIMCLDEKHKLLGIISTVIYENGTMKLRGGAIKLVKQAKTMTDDEIDELDAKDYKTVMTIKNDYMCKPIKFTESYKPDIEVIYICGNSDVGKTKYVYDMFKNMDNEPLVDTVKYDGKYWSGFNPGIEWAIYDEWRDSQMKPDEFIMFIDFYVKKMRCMYGYRHNYYKHIIITTTQRLEDIFKHSRENPLQWYKRISKYINLYDNYECTGREAYNNINDII